MPNEAEDLDFERLEPVMEEPASRVALVEDLSDEWRRRKNLPDVVFRFYRGYHLNDMAIWSFTVHGSRQITRGFGGLKRAWVASYKELLYAGPSYDCTRRPEQYDSSKRWTMLVRDTSPTLDGAVEELEKQRLIYLESLRGERIRYLKQIEELKASVGRFDRDLAESQPITLENLTVRCSRGQ